ncbi:MAG TPA: hypothetical protein VLT81_08560 [Chondromyces sp.]|nr:hypothetical protein [Chondromyces sp.]
MVDPRHTRLALIAILLVAFTLSASLSQATEPGNGIWIFKKDWANTVINLTNYTLRVKSYNVSEHDGCCPGTCGVTPFDLEGQHVGAMRSVQEGNAEGCSTDPLSFDGRVTFGFDGSYLSDMSFDVVMVKETSATSVGDLHHGTWVSLEPHSSSQSWIKSGTVCGMTAIPWGDNKMHNVMNLLSPKVQVVLYSMNNKDVTLVVRQSNENAAGWNDCTIYEAKRVEFVDAASDTVP